ncbi:MAG: hypothetical protein R3F60_08280 [bacterium]
MKRALAPLALALAAFAPGLAAAKGPFGLGLAIGDPTGVNGKYKLGQSTAVDGTVGLSLVNGNRLSTHLDFHWVRPLQGIVSWYVGLGGKLVAYDRDHDKHGHDDDGIWMGARAPLGLDLEFRGVPLDLFIEIAAVLWVVERVDLDLDGAIGVRYWF